MSRADTGIDFYDVDQLQSPSLNGALTYAQKRDCGN